MPGGAAYSVDRGRTCSSTDATLGVNCWFKHVARLSDHCFLRSHLFATPQKRVGSTNSSSLSAFHTVNTYNGSCRRPLRHAAVVPGRDAGNSHPEADPQRSPLHGLCQPGAPWQRTRSFSRCFDGPGLRGVRWSHSAQLHPTPRPPRPPQLLTTTCTASLNDLSTAVDNCQTLVNIVVDVAAGQKTAPTTCDATCSQSIDAVGCSDLAV